MFRDAEKIRPHFFDDGAPTGTIVGAFCRARTHGFTVIKFDRQVAHWCAVLWIGPVSNDRSRNINRSKLKMSEHKRAINQRAADDEKTDLPAEGQLLPDQQETQDLTVGTHEAADVLGQGVPRLAPRRKPIALINSGGSGTGIAKAAAGEDRRLPDRPDREKIPLCALTFSNARVFPSRDTDRQATNSALRGRNKRPG